MKNKQIDKDANRKGWQCNLPQSNILDREWFICNRNCSWHSCWTETGVQKYNFRKWTIHWSDLSPTSGHVTNHGIFHLRVLIVVVCAPLEHFCLTNVRCLLRITHSRYCSAVQSLLILLVVVCHLDTLGLSNVHCTLLKYCSAVQIFHLLMLLVVICAPLEHWCACTLCIDTDGLCTIFNSAECRLLWCTTLCWALMLLRNVFLLILVRC